MWEEAFRRLADVDGEPRPYFLGYGEANHIPKFLRSKEPRIENTRMSKRDTEIMIKEVGPVVGDRHAAANGLGSDAH